jgi:hypothetical protein
VKGGKTVVTIAIQTEETIFQALKEIAEQKQISLEDVTQEALRQYLQSQTLTPSPYSFIGIARSGKGQLSTQVNAVLAQAANRREGWSQAE